MSVKCCLQVRCCISVVFEVEHRGVHWKENKLNTQTDSVILVFDQKMSDLNR
jgi:hypothetical protein